MVEISVHCKRWQLDLSCSARTATPFLGVGTADPLGAAGVLAEVCMSWLPRWRLLPRFLTLPPRPSLPLHRSAPIRNSTHSLWLFCERISPLSPHSCPTSFGPALPLASEAALATYSASAPAFPPLLPSLLPPAAL